ncbi:MAG: hypothetical protein IJ066_02955 [Bacteroidaceae bacterium]|nr:hypothetical protein [Bacteroidaceae bacterium]
MSEKIADSTYQVWERVADDIDVNHLERLEQCDLEHSSTVKISRFERKIKKWLIFTLPSKYKIFGSLFFYGVITLVCIPRGRQTTPFTKVSILRIASLSVAERLFSAKSQDIERDIPVLLSLFSTFISFLFFSEKGYFVAF